MKDAPKPKKTLKKRTGAPRSAGRRPAMQDDRLDDQLLHEQSRVLFETMSQGVVFRDHEARIVAANPAAERIFGRSLKDLAGKTSAEVHLNALGEDGKPLAPDQFPAETALRTGKPVTDFILTIQNPGDVRRRWIKVNAIPFSLRDSPKPLVYVLFEDITERRQMALELEKARDHLEQEVQQRTRELMNANEALGTEIAVRERAESALRDSEERFRRLAENAQDLIYVYRLVPDRRFEFVSPSSTAVTGYTPEEHYADPDLGMKIVHTDDRRKLLDMAKIAAIPSEPLVLRWVRKDGRIIWTEQRNIPITDAAGRTVAIQGIARDITDRIRMEEKLQANERFLQTIIESEPDCVKLLARDGTLLMMNRAGLAMIGAKSIDMVQGRSVYGIILPEYRPGFIALTESVFDGKSGTLEFEAVGFKGRHIWLETHAVPLRDEQNEIIAALGLTRDITERKRMQEKLRESAESLQEAQRLAAIGSWEWLPRTGEFRWSLETCRILGIAPSAEPAYETFLHAVHDQDRESVTRALDAALRRKQPIDIEHRVIRQDGSVRIVHSRGQITCDPTGEPVHILGTLQDLTERRRAEDLLPRIAQQISEKTGDDYLRAVAEFTARELGTDIAFIGEIPGPGKLVRTVTVYAQGRFVENFEYDLQNTPCDNVVGKTVCFYPDRIQAIFPKDTMLVDRGMHSFAGIPLFSSEGDPVGLLATLGSRPMQPGDRDRIVTLLRIFAGRASAELERRRSEKALQESEKRYRQLLESVTSYIYTVTIEQGRAVSTVHGSACAAVTGYTSAEYAADPFLWYQMVHDPDKPAVLAQAAHVMAGGKPEPLEHRVRHKNGKLVWIRNSVVPRYDDKGRLTSYDGLIVDITERKRTEDFVRNILDAVDEGFIVIDRDYTIIAANRAYCGQIGLPAGDVVGKKCYAVSHKISGPCYQHGEECAVRTAFETGRPHSVDHTHHGGEGRPLVVETKAFPLKDESGNIFAAIEIVNNMTDRHRLEDQLRHAQKMEAVGLLAGGVAHDFNNILTAIVGYGNLLKMKTAGDDPRQTYIDQVLGSASRAANLTQSLLAFSRKQMIYPQPMDLNDTIRRVERLLQRVIGEDIDLRTELFSSAVTILADSSQIEQVLMNLATNARDAMPRGGKLTISTDTAVIDDTFKRHHGFGIPGTYARITVADSGAGMDEATRGRIFDPFFTTKEMGKGTGLGLAIVYGIMKQNSGYITVESEPGKGSSFRLYFPLIAEAAKETPAAEQATYQEGHETVLVAEDDTALRQLTRTMMTEFGYTVIEAVDGEDAVRKFRENQERVQLVILDVVMPKKNGREVRDEIRAIRPDAKVLFISGYGADILASKGLGEGTDEYLLKPVSPMDLLRKVRKVLDSAK
ncbi:MAG: PAS domain S-box protein [Nitrospirota bacterium]|nr:PAS domain S-box protein [Nitrospirota bacterium]